MGGGRRVGETSSQGVSKTDIPKAVFIALDLFLGFVLLPLWDGISITKFTPYIMWDGVIFIQP